MEVEVDRCVFNSTDLNNIEYILSFYYNKLEYIRFSSSVGLFVGYTAFGVKQAEAWNNDPSELNRRRAEKERYCQHNIGNWYKASLSKSAKPYAKLHSETPPTGGHPAMLVCSVYDFYPKMIKVSWHRDGKEVTTDVTSTDELADGDWYYQIHSHLEYTPRSGEKISCVVDHVSLDEPLVNVWGKYLSVCSPVCLLTFSPVCSPFHLSVCSPVCLLTFSPVCLLTCLSAHLSPVCLLTFSPVCLLTFSPVCLLTCLLTVSPVCLLTCLSAHMSVC
ncbi:H-2 class II histocompatibility antigen, E-S beta chain-like isoform X2 [Labrus mixtus]|uniref:H-2 class II histocompatibility antigen, E-S beta chain-like isoform X2 n=1 Tax=Labrus mixtus TaxID=508554 RepID=UPI0029C07B99|nr:H-2 class II histocompatibility antigen, E-S beta chain-like isoform X2 [Labrus mixtus]